MSNNQQNNYLAQMEAIIRKNCLAKYSGLNVSAKEFIPYQTPLTSDILTDIIEKETDTLTDTLTDILTGIIEKETDILTGIIENELFDKLEIEFVLQNAWLFE